MRFIFFIIIGISLFLLANIVGLYFGDGQVPDVDGRIYGFTREESIKMWESDLKKFNIEEQVYDEPASNKEAD